MTAGDAKLEIQRLLGISPQDRAPVIGPRTRAAFERLSSMGNDREWPPTGEPDRMLGVIGGRHVYQSDGGLVYFTAGMTIDADGAPTAYHPTPGLGLDSLANAGRDGNWWGIATDTDHLAGQSGKGRPYIQGDTAPAWSTATRGYYVSTTAYADNPEYALNDQRRYTNSLEVPFIVVPAGFPVRVRLGSRARVTFRDKTIDAIVADIGPRDHIGEGSVALADRLGIPSDPRTGGVQSGVRYEITV